MKNTAEIRSNFIDFFVDLGHNHLPSSGLVPRNDPTLMFTNSGMVQFKDVFLGDDKIFDSNKKLIDKAVTAQKCLRAGGKHNDLENVGYTARHHTFFEMLGNFSFGDYFKAEAIEYAWNFVTKELGLDKSRLLATVYIDDDESAELWKKVAGLSSDRILRIKGSDNFWQMGEVGPCGPCSEIFFDHGEKVFGGMPGTKDQDGDRYCEIWNLVFMQYNKSADGALTDLPSKSVDTGMGLERTAAILQGVHDNYEIDSFKDLIDNIAETIKVKPCAENMSSFKVIADHLRSSCFLISEGVTPLNEGRGYVLRRIMRRMMRHAYKLGADKSIIYKSVPEIVRQFSSVYPELDQASAFIAETIRFEEERFGKLLSRGMKRFNEATGNLKEGDTFAGKSAFELYDTYGFPLDLVSDMLREKGATVDKEGFNEAMQQQKERARKSWQGSGESKQEKIWMSVKQEVGSSEFLGYAKSEAQAEILAIVSDGKTIDRAEAGSEKIAIIVNQTPFYSDAGGQAGDTGLITSKDVTIEIENCTRHSGIIAHWGKVTKGSIKLKDFVKMQINSKRREAIKRNHSVAHLMHAALKQTLGDHVAQRGAYIDDKVLRFDFSNPQALNSDQLEKIEAMVNEEIIFNSEVSTRLMAKDDAIASGATALFGEKYPDEVRVVTMGKNNLSIELCGGTHANRTGDIGSFFIKNESAIAAGVRRIEAVSALNAREFARDNLKILSTIGRTLNAPSSQVAERIKEISDNLAQAKKTIATAREKEALNSLEINEANIKGAIFTKIIVADLAPKDLKKLAGEKAILQSNGLVAAISSYDGRLTLAISLSPNEKNPKIDANILAKVAATILGGGGGGKREMAQAGGVNLNSTNECLEAIEKELEKAL